MLRWRTGSTQEDRDDYGAAIAAQRLDPDPEAARARVHQAAQRISTQDMITERVKLGRAQGNI